MLATLHYHDFSSFPKLTYTFLIPEVITQFNPGAELAKRATTGRATNEENAETETEPMNPEIKTRKCSKKYKALHTFFLLFHSLTYYV